MISTTLSAQETPQDTTRTEGHLGSITLPDPSLISSQYEYDPVLDRYIFRERIGEIQLSQPLILTPRQYEELMLKEDRGRYFKLKTDAQAGRKNNAEEIRKDLLPGFYVNSSFFESIFGGSEIDIIPQGTVEMDLGLLYTRQDNPAYSPRNQRNLTFDFDQRISLSLQGQIGERLGIIANYDTESTFDFQNQLKMEYTPTEDDIVRKIEVGNVNMPLSNALMQGAQSLFGLKTELQFGKTRVTGVFSEQKSERRTVNVEGGSTIEAFEKFVLDYDQDRHFFLAHFFRDHYDQALENYPFIDANIQVKRIQVWVTNRTNNIQNLQDTRNIVGIQDLGESPVEGNIGLENPPAGFFNQPPGAFPDNANNDLNPLGISGPAASVLTPAIRDVATVERGFSGVEVSEGTDYVKLENARQLKPNEYTLNTQLGYISLDQRLSNDEVLAVAFQYTVNGQVYQVGEFANDGVNATGDADSGDSDSNSQTNPRSNQNLVVKLLKSSITNVEEPIWDLMMKNIYSLGGYDLEREDFRLNILYTDPQPLNYIKPAGEGTQSLPEDVEETPLLRVFNLDRLNNNNDPINGGDGFFDYVPGITIDPSNGNIIFTSVEPFGAYLFQKLGADSGGGGESYEDKSTWNANQLKYVFRSLYRTTRTQAEQEEAEKNKFQLKGRYKSGEVEGIPIGFNLPQGSVTVTAGGRVLQEGVDYVVNYELGRVQILDEALLASSAPIQVNTENNALFGQQTKRFTGLNVEHMFNEDLLVGATFLNLRERPLTQKANYSYEPLNNSIVGFNLNYSTEVPFLTRLVNKLPNIDTDVESNFALTGEFAYLQPGAPQVNDFGGRTTTYIDDFEAAQTTIDISTPLSWELSSVPLGFGGELANGDLRSGYKRAKMAWYTIDPIFYSSRRPDGINDSDLSSYATRRVALSEIFPNTDVVQGQPQVVYTLDLAYYPGERGPYNYNPAATDGELPDPSGNFGGIMRGINTTNFEQSNVEFIEFWVMDPYIYEENQGNSGGTLFFNLGNISEDVVKDGRKQYENGLPRDGGNRNVINTSFGKVPADQALVYAFDSEGVERMNQDVGYEGLSDEEEAQKFPSFAHLADPSADNYEYFLSREGGIQERYRNYNGIEGNAPTQVGNTSRGNTTLPTVEDVNRDNTMNTIDSYFEYEVPFYPGMEIEDHEYITDAKELSITLKNGRELPVRWLQFKIPIYEPTDSKGGIADFRSIRFMRMHLTGFENPTLLRFGTMELVRGDYRRYTQSLKGQKAAPGNTNTLFEVSAVNIEENENRQPIPYVLPPGVVREELFESNTNIRQNEQSLSLRVCDLEAQDARAVYKNFQIDMRQYKNLELFLHAESMVNRPALREGELVAFLRIGTDFTDNYYQVEIPLSPSLFGARSADEIWPEINRLDLPLELLQQVKTSVLGDPSLQAGQLNFFDENLQVISRQEPYQSGELRIGIKGNPSFGNVRVLMLGLKNGLPEAGGRELCGEVWFNELRLSELNNEGGWASIVNMDTNLADFATLSATGRKSTVGFGSLNQGPNQRSREDVQQYDMVTNLNMGQLLPGKWGLRIPVNYSRGEELVTPKYDQEFLDLELETRLRDIQNPVERERIRKQSQAYTKRQSINVIGLRKERTGAAVPRPYDVENITISSSYNQVDHRDFEVEESLTQNVRLGATYEYSFNSTPVEPFKGIGALDGSEYFSLLKDFNVNPLPSNINASSNILRQYNEQKFRSLELTGEDIDLPRRYQRNFLFDWEYGINHQLTRALDLSFQASNNRIIRNYIDEEGFPDHRIGIWDDFFTIGKPDLHLQSLQINYDLPLEKLPLLRFLKATYSYSGNFQWQRGSRAFDNLEGIPRIGNTIQNSRTHQLNASLDMQNLYDYLGLVEKKPAGNRSIKSRSAGAPTLDDPVEPEQEGTVASTSKKGSGLNTLVRLTTFVKRIQVNYRDNEGTFLPGYIPDVGFMGTLRPTTGFTFGLQDEVRYLAARRGWLTLFQNFNQQFSRVSNKQLDVQASLELLPGMTIDLNANRNYAETFNENYRVAPATLDYRSLTPFSYGNFTISTILIRSSFSRAAEDFSATFERFRENRLSIARRLAREAGLDPSQTDEDGFPEGFGKTSQAVLLSAFTAAYSGKEPEAVSMGAFRDVPLPNWDLKYTGLMRLGWIRDKFRRLSLNHGYQASYTLNQFQTNLDYDPENRWATNQAGDFKNPLLFSNVVLTELFTPLVRVDLETKTAIQVLAEIRKDRALALSFDNNMLTETRGNEYRLGMGYRLRDLKITTSIGGRNQILSSDLVFKADVSFRRNNTVIRYLDLETSQVIAGQDLWAMNFTADYALSRNLTAIFYYDHSFSEYAVSTAFPQTTIRSGITLRYNFGN